MYLFACLCMACLRRGVVRNKSHREGSPGDRQHRTKSTSVPSALGHYPFRDEITHFLVWGRGGTGD